MYKEITYYPLTQSQKLVFLQMKFALHKQVVNIATEIELQSEVDQKVLLEAIYLAMMRCPAASVRLHKFEDKSVKQYFSDEAPDKIEYLDLTDITENDYEARLRKWASIPFPNKHMDTQLYCLRLMRKPNKKLAIYGVFSHCIYDAYAVMTTYRDVMEIYNAILNHTPMPKELPSPIPAYEADYKYCASEKRAADLKFFDEFIYDTEPQYTFFNGKNDSRFPKKTRYGTTVDLLKSKGDALDLVIDKDVADAVNTYAAQNKVSPQALYFLAFRSYLSKVCDTTDVTFMNSIARRATLAQKRAGSTMVNSTPIRFRFGNHLSFADACTETYRTQCEVFRHANANCAEVLNVGSKKYHAPSMRGYSPYGFSYQPYFMLGDDALSIKFRHLPNGYESQLLYMTIMPVDSYGTLGINYSYMTSYTTPEALKKFHVFLHRFLRAGTAQPDKSLTELMKD